MFTIEFAALNFYNPNRVFYRYILEGYEKEWHYNGKNRIASYTNVPPGSYTFRVETIDEANPELVSNRTLAITILPPWWLSWWAIVIYVVLGIIALYFSLRLAFFMIKMKNDIYIEQKVSEMKIKFFTNISHELRTPLTLIKGPIQELREHETLSPKGVQYVELMEKNTNQMLQLVNQILDFRKIQNGKMRLHVSLIDFNELVVSFQKEFRVLSEENEVSFTFQLPDAAIMIWADKEKLSIVIRNIISNAFKFTPSGGSIHVVAKVTYKGEVKSLVLTNARATTGDATQIGANKVTLSGSLIGFPADAEGGIIVSGIEGTENVRAGVRIATVPKESYTVDVEGLLANTLSLIHI